MSSQFLSLEEAAKKLLLNEREQEALKSLRWGSYADSGSTVATLAICTAAREINPLISWSPYGLASIPLSYGAYRLIKSSAASTSRFESSYRPIRGASYLRAAAAINNVNANADANVKADIETSSGTE